MSVVARAKKKGNESKEIFSLPEEEEEQNDDVDDLDDLDPGDNDDEEAAADEEVDDGGVSWGKKALAVARQVLEESKEDEGPALSLWSFRVHPSNKRVEIRLDKPSDPWGSPTLDDVSSFSRRFADALEEALPEGNETKVESGDIEVEASSAGAARKLRLPLDLERFSGMPLAVSPRAGTSAAEVIPKPHPAPLRVVSFGSGSSTESGTEVVVFATADVRVTRGNRGRLTKKQLEARYEVAVSELDKVTLYVDV